MGKSTSEQIKTSKDKKVIEKLTLAEVYDFLQQPDGKDKRSTKLLKAQYKDAISDSKTAHISRQDLLDRGFGKAPQSVDMTSAGEKLTSVMFDIFQNDKDK